MPIASIAALWCLVACSVPDEWREWQPDDSGLRVQTPCKPSTVARDVVLAGSARRMTMHTCRAADHLYALAWADVQSLTAVDDALLFLSTAARDNVAASEASLAIDLSVPGATPQARSGHWQWSGRLPDGRDVQQQHAVFARATRVYQASVVASSLDAHRADPFFASLKWQVPERRP